ncbi:hypothetical protein CLOM_g24586 [Closterium sp. NIES-68]|nr:hypothetical protein CLOM_g24586 [Closterium sp. NIES-68]
MAVRALQSSVHSAGFSTARAHNNLSNSLSTKSLHLESKQPTATLGRRVQSRPSRRHGLAVASQGPSAADSSPSHQATPQRTAAANSSAQGAHGKLAGAAQWLRKAAAGAVVGAATAAVLLMGIPAPSGAETVVSGAAEELEMSGAAVGEVQEDGVLTLILPRPLVTGVAAAQRTMVESWGIVREAFVDPTFNHQDWEDRLAAAIGGSLTAESADEAYALVDDMLASLGDPFTRLVSPGDYDSFRVSSDGSLDGVGLLLASDTQDGRLLVLSPIEGGPADRAGIHSGDEVVAVDHSPLTGMSGQEAANLLRGKAGTAVTLTVRPASADVDGADLLRDTTDIVLRREPIVMSPVYATVLPHQTDQGVASTTGYIRLASFSQNAADDMERAIERLEGQGVANYILDLRNNPGGLVRSGLEVARMWLGTGATLVNTVDRSGAVEAIALRNSRALTDRPLAVLVNHGSASASEIVAGALHDNGRAMLVGDTTYGKGRIQTVFELTDGSALFVTVAKYLSPALHDIDQVGIAPDLACSIPTLQPLPASASAVPGALTTPLPGIAVESMGGQQEAALPAGGAVGKLAVVVDEEVFGGELQRDSCVLTAERQLDRRG